MTAADDNLQTTDFGPDGFVARLFRGPRDAGYRRIIVAFVVASASHLWLADAAEPDWMPANIVYVLGIVLLVVGRGAIGWLFCAVGLAIPLLFLRDQLTQSMLLLVVCMGGVVTTLRGPRPDEFARLCRGLLVMTYLFAAFHKLNRDFFDPAVSCVGYGLTELAEYYHLSPSIFSTFNDVHGLLAVAIEAAIPIAYLAGRRRLARLIAVVFHIPLTLTMAPAFVFVMLVGHAAWLTESDARGMKEVWRDYRKSLLAFAFAATAASLGLHGDLPEWTMIPREFALWFALALTSIAMWRGEDVHEPRQDQGTLAVRLLLGLFALNCLTPYLGLQYQHSAAMLSNMRIDRGCWNHYIVPEFVRLRDDYIRVESVQFGAPETLPDYRESVLTQLWSPPQFRQIRRNWCRPDIRPLSMAGTYRGEHWAVADLCDEGEAWPFAHAGVLGVELFGDFLRFQKNLERACPQRCIH